MSTENKDYFVLYACCIPVQGASNSILCDLQRQVHFNIPNIVYEILTKFARRRVHEVKDFFLNEKNEEIDEYFDQLVENEYGFFTNEVINFPELDLSQFRYSGVISNAIVDFDKSSDHDLKKIINELNILMCEALEIRFFEKITWEKLFSYLASTQDSTLRSIEIIIKYDENTDRDEILNLESHFARLKKVTVHGAPFDECVETENMVFYFTREVISSEKCCGIVSPWYFITETNCFIEAHHHNSCLNKKVGIDKEGNIKNCPSMKLNYGNIKQNSIANAVNLSGFQEVWNVTKDVIEICKDCEFRYICQDCRAYTVDANNNYSKPLKCNYDPYSAKWN